MNPLKLSALILATTALVTGCGSQRSLSVTPGTRLTTITRPEPTRQTVPSFTMALQSPAPVRAPAPCPGCIGVGYDSETSLQVELTALDGFIGQVALSVSGLPPGITLAAPVPPVALNTGNAPSIQVIPVQLYVLPGVAPGAYSFTIVGASSSAAVNLPVVLTITSPASAAWRAQ